MRMPHKINDNVCHAHSVIHVRAKNESSIPYSNNIVLDRRDRDDAITSMISTSGVFYSVQGYFFSRGTRRKAPHGISHVFIFVHISNVRNVQKFAPYENFPLYGIARTSCAHCCFVNIPILINCRIIVAS